MRLLENLNDNQREAVLHTEGPLLILAGAGSGKTRVITHRIAYLIKEKQVPPYGIFAVTFTNKAAGEMRKRIVDLIGPTGEGVFIKTFHSAAVYMLRRYGDRIGVQKSYSIYDQKDQESVIKEILLEMRLDPKHVRPSSLSSKISEIKNRQEMLDGADITALMPRGHAYNFQEIYEQYHSRLEKNNALDFDDLLIKTVELLRHHNDVLETLQGRWHYFMIDEYQDTNYAQYLIGSLLASKSKNLCVVGDDDQSIYSWRGADIRNILNFEKDYSDTRVIVLEENYRSAAPILEAASSVISNNSCRKEKNLKACRGEGERVVWCRASNEYGEAEFVVNSLIRLRRQEGFSSRDFAIFYRTNAQSRVFEDVLRRENVGYRVVGGLRFYDRKEVKDTVAFLKFLANPVDSVALERVINTPPRGIGKATVDKIFDAAYEADISPWEVIEGEIALKGKMPKGLLEFKKIILTLREGLALVPHKKKLSDITGDVLELTGYIRSLEEENSLESRSRLENIDEFINSVYEYEERNPDVGLDQFLQDISLLTSEEDPEARMSEGNNLVTLMTVHNAKGLEFPVVFLTGMEEDIFPHFNSSDTEEGVEEERRLCYVGMTRAMERLFITSAEVRRRYNESVFREPSRFVFEISGAVLDSLEYTSNGYGYSGGPSERRYSSRGASSALNQGDRGTENLVSTLTADEQEERASAEADRKFRLKESVLHPKYGRGIVTRIEGKGDNTKLTICFEMWGNKTFLEKYTPLEKAP